MTEQPQHTPAPWRVANNAPGEITAKGGDIAAMSHPAKGDWKANAAHIVVCVNACAVYHTSNFSNNKKVTGNGCNSQNSIFNNL